VSACPAAQAQARGVRPALSCLRASTSASKTLLGFSALQWRSAQANLEYPNPAAKCRRVGPPDWRGSAPARQGRTTASYKTKVDTTLFTFHFTLSHKVCCMYRCTRIVLWIRNQLKSYLAISNQSLFQMSCGWRRTGSLQTSLDVRKTVQQSFFWARFARGRSTIFKGNAIGHDETVASYLKGRYSGCVRGTSTTQYAWLHEARFYRFRVEKYWIRLGIATAGPWTSN